MKYCSIITLLIYALHSFPVHAQLSPESMIENKTMLLQLETNWLKAEFSLDTAYLSSIIDTGFIDITEEGIHNKRESLLSMYNNISQRLRDSIVIDSFNLENTVVNIYNDMAIVIFIVHTHGKNKSQLTERKTRFYDVWIKRNNEWKAVASQGSNVN